MKDGEKRDRYIDLVREQKNKTKKQNKTKTKTRKTMEHESDGDTNSNWCAQNNLQRLRNKGASEDHPNYSTSKIG